MNDAYVAIVSVVLPTKSAVLLCSGSYGDAPIPAFSFVDTNSGIWAYKNTHYL